MQMFGLNYSQKKFDAVTWQLEKSLGTQESQISFLLKCTDAKGQENCHTGFRGFPQVCFFSEKIIYPI